MDLGLKGRRALVLASTKGLGRAVATALAGEGTSVMICGRFGAAQAAAEISRETSGAVMGRDCDLHDRAAIDDLFQAAVGEMGGVDILVLNSGGPPPAPALEVSGKAWSEWLSAWSEISSMQPPWPFRPCASAAGDDFLRSRPQPPCSRSQVWRCRTA